MKKLLSFLLAAVTLAASAQTNVVKVSALPSATTPLAGTEIVPLNQSGATKTATVAQIIASAVAQNNATASALTTASNALTSAVTTTSNALASAVTVQTAANLTTSNRMVTVTAANASAITGASNAITALLPGYYPTNNPSGYQTASQVSTIANGAAAAALAGVTQSNGVASFAAVTATNVFYNVVDLGGLTNTASLTINASAATIQRLTVTATNSGTKNATLSLSNLSSGQNVYVLVQRTDWIIGATMNVVLPSGTINLNSGAATFISVPTGKSLLLSFTVLGSSLSSVVMSAALQQ